MSDTPDPSPVPAPEPMARQPLSPDMQKLSEAIRAQPQPPRVALCGFDLWLEILGSGHTSTRPFVAGGIPAKGDEPETVVTVPMMVLGGRIVISCDPTLPPKGFELKL